MNADDINPNVNWTPIQQSGSNFGTHKLKKISDERLDFIPTPAFINFSLFFVISGLFVLIRVLFFLGLETDNSYVALVVGCLFFLVGICLLCVNNNRVIFKKIDTNWRISKSNVFSKKVKFFPYKPMYAVQVLQKHYDSFNYYELNIVYEDGSRESILNQGDGDLVIKNGLVLAESIGILFLNGVKEGERLSKWGEFRPVFWPRKRKVK